MKQTIPLGQVVKIRKGKKAAMVFDAPMAGSLPYLQIDEVRGVTPSKFASDPKGVEVTANDLCIVWDGANAGTVGYGVTGFIGSTVARMRFIEPDEWEARFLGRLLELKFQELNDQAKARGATIPHVDKNKLESIEFPHLKKDEQCRIAVILDKADSIHRQRKQALSLAEAFIKSTYINLLGFRHPDFNSWEPFSVENLAEDRKGSIRSGPFGSALRHSEFVDDGIAVLGIDNAVKNRFQWAERRFITEEKYQDLKRYKVFPDDVIVTIMGTTGRSAVVPDDIPEAITTKHLATITCDKKLIHPEVLSYAIHSDPMIMRQVEAQNKGAIMNGLNLGIIRKLMINRPPMENQLQFVAALKKVRSMCDEMASSNGSGGALLGSLSQRAFRGEL